MNMMCNTPWFDPRLSSRGAPTAKSSTPSPSRSPMFAMDSPKRSWSINTGPFTVESLIATVDFTEPSEVVPSVNLIVSDSD